MAVTVERVGNRTVVSQTRRGVRIAAWVLFALAMVGAVLTFTESNGGPTLASDRTTVRCERSIGRCEVARGGDTRVMELESITGFKLETDGSGPDARVIAVITRRHGLPNHTLCEARASQREAAGVKGMADQLARFVADRNLPSAAAACDTRRSVPSTGTVAARVAAQTGGVLLMILALLLFLVEVRTEVDPDAGVVRVRGRSFVPPRRWALERSIGEVASVMIRQRALGRERSFRVYIHFKDGSSAMLLSPVTWYATRVDGWLKELREALGLAAPGS